MYHPWYPWYQSLGRTIRHGAELNLWWGSQSSASRLSSKVPVLPPNQKLSMDIRISWKMSHTRVHRHFVGPIFVDDVLFLVVRDVRVPRCLPALPRCKVEEVSTERGSCSGAPGGPGPWLCWSCPHHFPRPFFSNLHFSCWWKICLFLYNIQEKKHEKTINSIQKTMNNFGSSFNLALVFWPFAEFLRLDQGGGLGLLGPGTRPWMLVLVGMMRGQPAVQWGGWLWTHQIGIPVAQ